MTDRVRWQRIETILDELLDLTEKEQRVRLAELTRNEVELRPHIERLLAADSGTRAGILDRGLAPLADGVLGAEEASSYSGNRIGPYRVLRELGRGGMGEVLLAERADGEFEQQVALKIVRGGLNRTEIVERFRRERRILARLRHPNIAALYDGGATGEGVPWFAMEYVEGERITDWCDERRLGIDARVELFGAVCRAVQYAHQNLVLHRDIKPSNVFVTSDGTVKLLDFGIGKLLDTDADETQATQGFLTPAFSAPEQILGGATSTASDVYSLGVLLHVLLTGHHPHGDTSRSVEIARAIAEKEPPEASGLVVKDTTTMSAAEIARLRRAEPEELRRRLKGDLDNILGKALRKNPDERYASAEALGADLVRYRNSLPVEARKATVRYRFRKFVRRHRVGTLAGAATLLAIIGGVSGVLWQTNIAARERDRARAVKDYLIEVFSAADPEYESGETLTAVELVERGATRISDRFEGQPEIRAEIMRVLGAVLINLAQYDRAEEVLVEALGEERQLDDPEGLHETLLRLGETAQWRGETDVALERYEEAAELARRTFGPDDPRSLETITSMADQLIDMGRADEAGRLFREALDRSIRVFGDESEGTALRRLGLAKYLFRVGELEAAEREARAAIEAYHRSGVRGVPLADGLSALGATLARRDKGPETEAVLREAVAVLREEYGEMGHPKLAEALENLAGPLMGQDVAEVAGSERLAEAEACMREANEMIRRTVGEDSWLVATSSSNLSVVLTKQGDIEGAGELLAESVRIARAKFGDRHPVLAAPLSNLAWNLLRQKRYEEAEAVYADAISVARECFGARHPNVAHPVAGRAQLYYETERYPEAEAAAREAWGIRHDALGASHSLVVETRVQIADVLAAAGRAVEAAALLDSAITDARGGLPQTRTVLATALVTRAKRARDLAEPASAVEAFLAEALAIREEEYGAEDDRVVEVRGELASVRGEPTMD